MDSPEDMLRSMMKVNLPPDKQAQVEAEGAEAEAEAPAEARPIVVVEFTGPGSLGIRFEKGRGACLGRPRVGKIKLGTQAESKPELVVGLELVAVEEGAAAPGEEGVVTDVSQMEYHDLLETLRIARRPTKLHFEPVPGAPE